MTRVVVAWVVAWAGVYLTAATQLTKIHGSLLNVCVSMGSSLTYQSATYELAAASETLCAALCLDKGAQKYTISGASCTLYSEGLLPSSSAYTFANFPSSSTLEDVATGKTAYASSIHSSGYAAALAVDTVESDTSMFHSSADDADPWWLLDLGEMRHIHDVQIVSRHGCCPERLHDIEIRVGGAYVSNGDFSSYTLFATYMGPYSSDQGRLSCPRREGVSGRFVSIAKAQTYTGALVLQLVDVNVLVSKITT